MGLHVRTSFLEDTRPMTDWVTHLANGGESWSHTLDSGEYQVDGIRPALDAILF
jgi:hypothetical protein